MVNWFAWKRGYLGKSILQKWLLQLSDTVAHKDKTLPRIQKHIPESKNTSQNPKHFPESKNTSQNQKDFPESKTGPRIQNTSQIWILESVYEFWDVFWIPGSVFLDSGKCFGFWEVFCLYEPPYRTDVMTILETWFGWIACTSTSPLYQTTVWQTWATANNKM